MHGNFMEKMTKLFFSFVVFVFLAFIFMLTRILTKEKSFILLLYLTE